MSVKVLYNDCAGCFAIPEDVEEEFFRRFPAKFHSKQNAAVYFDSLEEFQKSNGLYYWGWLICEKRSVCPGYQQLKLRNIYSAPILTQNARGVEESQQMEYWSSMVQEEATGDIYCTELDVDEFPALRVQPELIGILTEKGFINLQTETTCLKLADVPEECEWQIVEREDGKETVNVKSPIRRILSELLAAVDASRLSGDACKITQDLVAGRLQVSDLQF